jgi:type IX secretion system PorP/SprF family membrane protein
MRKVIQYIICYLSCITATAQDIHFSQYIYSPLNLNPALTGMFDGDMRFNAAYRQQWNSVTVPYKTFSLSYDQVIGKTDATGKRNSAGIVINNDKAGDGNYGTMQVLFSFAHLFPLTSDSIHFINASVQAGIAYRSLDVNQLTFDNQFNGDVYIPSSSTGENFDRSNYIYPEINAGLSWLGIFDNADYNAGISFQHLTQPNQSFFNENAVLPVRLQFSASSVLMKNEKINYMPSVLLMQQAKFAEFTFGGEIRFNLSNSTIRKSFGIGLNYRIKDAIIPGAAVWFNQWRFGLTYDINTSDLNSASNSKGGPEFNLIYILKKVHYSPVKANCPVY